MVACSGRNTRFLDQLATAGFPVPEVSAVGIDLDCGTLTVRRRPDDLDGTLAIVVEDPDRGHRMGMLVPAEGDQVDRHPRFFHGDVPTTEADAYEDFAAPSRRP